MEIKSLLEKPYTDEQYADLAVYCNENNLIIADRGDYLESVPYEPSEDEKKQTVYSIRATYFSDYVDWYQSKPLLWEELTEEEKTNIKNYRQYLKDYTEEEKWWERNPLTFEEWLKNN